MAGVLKFIFYTIASIIGLLFFMTILFGNSSDTPTVRSGARIPHTPDSREWQALVVAAGQAGVFIPVADKCHFSSDPILSAVKEFRDRFSLSASQNDEFSKIMANYIVLGTGPSGASAQKKITPAQCADFQRKMDDAVAMIRRFE